jgi:hypothetical protein
MEFVSTTETYELERIYQTVEGYFFLFTNKNQNRELLGKTPRDALLHHFRL